MNLKVVVGVSLFQTNKRKEPSYQSCQQVTKLFAISYFVQYKYIVLLTSYDLIQKLFVFNFWS